MHGRDEYFNRYAHIEGVQMEGWGQLFGGVGIRPG